MSSLNKDSYKDAVESAKIIEKIFNQRNVKLNSSSFIKKCIESAYKLNDYWERKDYSITHNETLFKEILYHTLECHRIGIALKQIEEKQELEKKLNLIIKKRIWPFEKFRQNRAKDYIFEIYTLARFEKANLNPRFEEPDIVFRYGADEFSVACKYIHSEKRIEKNVKKAVRQIENSKKLGIILIGIDEVSPHHVEHNSTIELNKFLDETFAKFVNKYDEKLKIAMKNEKVLGLVMSYSTSVIIKDKNLPTIVHEWGIDRRLSQESINFSLLEQIVNKLIATV